MRIVLLIFIFLFSWSNLFADQPRYRNNFKSSNKIYEFRISETKKDSILIDNEYQKFNSEYKWELVNRISKKTKYKIETKASEKTAFVSNNGAYVVIINDWPSEIPDDNLEMIVIYKNGALVKSIKLNDILDCGYNISSSVSHFNWSIGEPKVSFNKNKISFITYELNEIDISIKDGEISKSKNKLVNNNSLLIYGQIIDKKNEFYKIEVCHKVFGILPSSIIEFISVKDFRLNDYMTVLINNENEVNIIYNKINLNDINLNNCVIEPEKFKDGYLGFGNINCVQLR